MWYCQKNRQIDLWTTTESPEIDSHKYSQLIFDKGAKAAQGRRDRVLNKQRWDSWASACHIVNLYTDLIRSTELNSKWIIGLNVKHKTIKLLEDNRGENLDDLGYGDAFVDSTSKAQSMTEIIDKLNVIRIETFCPVKDNVKRIRRQATDWEKIFAEDMS